MNLLPALLIVGFFIWLFIDFIKTKKYPHDKDPDEIPDDSVDFWNN
jgi:hypothetical protein